MSTRYKINDYDEYKVFLDKTRKNFESIESKFNKLSSLIDVESSSVTINLLSQIDQNQKNQQEFSLDEDGNLLYNDNDVIRGTEFLFFDKDNDRFGIGTSTPDTIVHLTSSSSIRFTFDNNELANEDGNSSSMLLFKASKFDETNYTASYIESCNHGDDDNQETRLEFGINRGSDDDDISRILSMQPDAEFEFVNSVQSNADNGRPVDIIAVGYNTDGDSSYSGKVRFCKDGANADNKGKLLLYLNDGTDDDDDLTTIADIRINGVSRITNTILGYISSDTDDGVILMNNWNSNTNTESPRLCFFGGYGDSGQITGPALQKLGTDSYGRGRLAILQHGAEDYTTLTEVMTINYNGNIGINVTDGSSKFNVVGSSTLKGVLTVTDEVVMSTDASVGGTLTVTGEVDATDDIITDSSFRIDGDTESGEAGARIYKNSNTLYISHKDSGNIVIQGDNVDGTTNILTLDPNGYSSLQNTELTIIKGAGNGLVLANNWDTSINEPSPKLCFFGGYDGSKITGPYIQKVEGGLSYGRGRLAFLQHPGEDYTSISEVMTIDWTENVGIKDSNPLYRLTVDGDVKISTTSAFRIGGSTESGADGVRIHMNGDHSYIDHKGGGSMHLRSNDVNGGADVIVYKDDQVIVYGTLTSSGDVTFNANGTFGNATTDVFTMIGRLVHRTVGSDPTANNNAGSLGEIVNYNDKLYYKTVADGNDKNWEKLAISSSGIDTTFIDNDGNTITVSGGIITAKTAP